MVEITKNLVEIANEYLAEDDYLNFFDLFFSGVGEDVDDGEDIEMETWTSGGVNMIVSLTYNDNILDEFCKYANDFDIDEEIRIMREDSYGEYCSAFTCRESVEDYEEYKDWLEEISDIITGNWKEKKAIDECPDDSVLNRIIELMANGDCPNEKEDIINYVKRHWDNN